MKLRNSTSFTSSAPIKPVKKVEFQWNKVCPEKDYLYFLDNRICAHINTLVCEYPKINYVYLCAKENGDLNAVLGKIKKVPKGYVVAYVKTYDGSAYGLFDLARVDTCAGQLGDFVYCLIQLTGSMGLVLHKIPLKVFPQKKKIIERLDWYRTHGVSDANTRFNDLYLLASEEQAFVRVDPRKKKTRLFRHGEQ